MIFLGEFSESNLLNKHPRGLKDEHNKTENAAIGWS